MDRFSRKDVENLFKKLYPFNLIHSLDELIFAGLKFKECTDLILKFDFNNVFDLIIFHNKFFNENLEKIKSKFKKIKKGVYFGKDVSISKKVDFDTKEGIIIIENKVRIPSYAYIKGPCLIGTGTYIAPFSIIRNSYIGKFCKIGGEVAKSVILNYTNKVHYGYIGSSYIGSWVNLGAGTTNSNLKNTYGEIKVEVNRERINTKQTHLGCIIGDYSRTAIGTLIMCGKIIGINSHLYGTVKENIPCFVNYINGEMIEFKLEKAIEIQRRIFKRKGKIPTKNDINLLKEAFEITKDERKGIKRGKLKL